MLITYEEISGQVINYNKSGTFFSSNVDDVTKLQIADIFGIYHPLNKGRYLGLPSLVGRNKKQVFVYIREKMWARLNSWSNKKIFNAGKEVLIKYAAQAIPTYCMSIFLLPTSLLDELHKMLNKFWWTNDSRNNKGVVWAKWEDLCDARGIGF